MHHIDANKTGSELGLLFGKKWKSDCIQSGIFQGWEWEWDNVVKIGANRDTNIIPSHL